MLQRRLILRPQWLLVELAEYLRLQIWKPVLEASVLTVVTQRLDVDRGDDVAVADDRIRGLGLAAIEGRVAVSPVSFSYFGQHPGDVHIQYGFVTGGDF